MNSDFYNRQKQLASAFWKSYFAKFQYPIDDDEASETVPARLSKDAPLQFPERRVSGSRRNSSLRSR